jgi:6-pyruvoyltetrahydropterin/6-carboxytetrahydropterin synthase
MGLTISKKFQWHMAHRLPDHPGGCRNVHGHTYRLQVRIARRGELNGAGPQRGMVVDFHLLKEVVDQAVLGPLDHCLVYWEGDPLLSAVAALGAQEDPPLKVLKLPFTSTVENLVTWMAGRLQEALRARDPSLVLARLKLNESPTSAATWTPD